MVPIQRSRMRNDEFVLTISDDETEVPNLDDAPSSETEAPPKATISKKRKRGGETHEDTRDLAQKKKKKKINGNGNDVPDRPTQSESEESDSQLKGEDDGAMDSDFEFQTGETHPGKLDDFDGWGLEETSGEQRQGGDKKPVDIDEIIARRRQQKSAHAGVNRREDGIQDDEVSLNHHLSGEELGVASAGKWKEEPFALDGSDVGADAEEAESQESTENMSAGEASDDSSNNEDNEMTEPVPHPDDVSTDEGGDERQEDNDEETDPAELERRTAFFAPESDTHESPAIGTPNSFQGMALSRPILRGLAAVGFSSATPIQAKTIPIALLGKDVVGGAVTGSGKTAAFIIPILERLLYRPKKVPATRVVVLMPTRELAVQCFSVATKLASFTDVTFVQLVGGYSPREQEQRLKKRPDIIIATPGRFIDHMLNTASFAIDTIEILVLDEADRMLEDGFADELDTILKTLPKSRQTMLFSATMTDSVDKLIRVGLNRPVRLMVDAKRQTVSGLVQEFVRLRPGKEDKRLPYLMYLCTEIYTDRVIIFFRQKKEAHHMRVIFGLCGLKAGELHGSMSQEQRIQAVESFRSGSTSFLLATDLASRGLDIRNITTVLNFTAPQSHDIYLHRVGRTARAGRSGRACTLAAEPDRKIVKQAVKSARAQGAKIASRTVPTDKAEEWTERLRGLEEEIEEVLREEKEERIMAQAEMQVKKGDNLIKHEDEIMSRPKRTWFESEKEKRAAKDRGRLELNGSEVAKRKKAKRKLSNKEKKALNDHDERVEGKTWKKGRAERAGKGTSGNPGKGMRRKGKASSGKDASSLKSKRKG